MVAQAGYLRVEDYSDRQKKSVRRILDVYDRNDTRSSDSFQAYRSHERKSFRGLVRIRLSEQDQPVEVNAFTRDVSAGGLSFLYPGELEQNSFVLGLEIPGSNIAWFQGEVVRSKKCMEEGFWEYGVKFTGRLPV